MSSSRSTRTAQALGLVAVVVLLSACASGPRVSPAPAQTRSAIPGPERDAALAESANLVLLAREHARLGLIEQAVQSWERAIDVLAPLAESDPSIAERIQQIAAEQERAVADAAAHEDAGSESERQLAEERAEMLEGPGPALDPSHVGEVDQAARGVQPDYPIVLNDQVIAWIEALSGNKLRDWFTRSLQRSGGYVERFRQIFAEEGLPQDLVYLVHIESAFQSHALSRAKARGMFQFISATGKRYGLVIDSWVDERADPEKACRAAAAYLRDLYAEFGDWNLALASYNAGEGRVRAGIARTGSRDFWVLSQRGTLRAETRNYVPAIHAATIIAKDPARFGFGGVVYDVPVQYEVATVPFSADLKTLAFVAGTEPATLRALNPELRRGVTPSGRTYLLKVPAGASDGFADRLAQVPPNKRIAQVEHRVRRGETLSSIGRRYGVSVSALREANGLSRKSYLKVGQTLVIPGGGFDIANLPDDEPVARGASQTHLVRRGETLGSISKRYGVRVKDLQSWNRMGSSTRLIAGKTIRVSPPGSADGSRASKTVASEAAASRSATVHVVRAGETPSGIARHYGVNLDAFLAVNRLTPRSTIHVGQRLAVPATGGSGSASGTASSGQKAQQVATVHVVKKGETLFRIAQRYGTTVERLCEANDIRKDSILRPGTTLSISR